MPLLVPEAARSELDQVFLHGPEPCHVNIPTEQLESLGKLGPFKQNIFYIAKCKCIYI